MLRTSSIGNPCGILIYMKRADAVIIFIIAALSLLPLLLLPRGGEAVTVTWRGETIYRGSRSADQRIVTPDGKNTVVIAGGRATMEKADCPDGLCISAGSATALRPVVCLPNEVVVTVSKGEESGYDALAH